MYYAADGVVYRVASVGGPSTNVKRGDEVTAANLTYRKEFASVPNFLTGF